MRNRLVALLLVVAAIVVAAYADRETAQFSASRADKALAAKKWEEAEGLYRKAIEEDETFLPARFGLAQALVGEGKTGPAVEELRKFVDDARAATPPIAADWKTVLAKAEKQLTDLDAAGAALQKIEDTYANALVDLAQRLLTKDPETADRALRRSLKLKPGFPKAMQLLEKSGRSTASQVVQLFDGKSVEGWVFADPPMWTVSEGALVGEYKNAAAIVRTVKSFDGDFTVRIEARVLAEFAQPVFFAFMPCYKGDHDYYSFGVLRGKLVWADEQTADKGRDVVALLPTDLKKPFDPAQWNTYELRVSGKSVVALVNGEEIGHEERPDWRPGGYVGLKAQNLKVAFRKVEVELK